MLRKTILHDRAVEYMVKKSRRARNMRLTVRCDASVVVTAPFYLGENNIERFVQQKASWVIEKVDHFLKLGQTIPIHRGRCDYKQHREQARAFVCEKIEKINQLYNFSFGRIAIKNNRSCWGSCSRRRNLNFNYKIIFLPERLAEYIVAHELCHLQEFNHSKNFWNLVSRFEPDYKAIRKQTKKQIL